MTLYQKFEIVAASRLTSFGDGPECLDHLLILHERQLQRILNAYVSYFNQARPHQGIQQQIPECSGSSRATAHEGTKVVAVPILAGLHHDYRKVA